MNVNQSWLVTALAHIELYEATSTLSDLLDIPKASQER
jgi:hypothetical protein